MKITMIILLAIGLIHSALLYGCLVSAGLFDKAHGLK